MVPPADRLSRSTLAGTPPDDSGYETMEQQRVRLLQKPRIPAADEIESMTAECYAHIFSPFIKDTPRFTVPREDYQRVLSNFRDTGLDEEPWPDDRELGTIRFVYKGGRTIRICWFWTGHKGPMTFTWAGIRYKTTFVNLSDDVALAFDATMRGIYDQQVAARQPQAEPSSGPRGAVARPGRGCQPRAHCHRRRRCSKS